MTTPIRIYPDDVVSSHRLYEPARPKSLHFPTAPPRTKAILDQVERIDAGLRQEGEDEGWSPELVWEPFPVSPEYELFINECRSLIADRSRPDMVGCVTSEQLYSRRIRRSSRVDASGDDHLA